MQARYTETAPHRSRVKLINNVAKMCDRLEIDNTHTTALRSQGSSGAGLMISMSEYQQDWVFFLIFL